MKKLVFILFISIFYISCKDKTTDLNDDNATIKPNEFLSAFSILDNSFLVTDSNVFKEFESQNLSNNLLERFCGQQVLETLTNHNNKVKLYALGRVSKSNESYILVLANDGKVASVFTLLFDKQNKFITQKKLLTFDKSSSQNKQMLTVNKEPTFFITKTKNTNPNDLKYSKIGLAYSNNNFIEVFKESNEAKAGKDAVINPIESMLSLNQYSGDYELDNRNFISVRDGVSKKDYVFFLHIEKNEGNCVGEIKGSMQFTDSTNAVYNAAGDACKIDFSFTNRVITVKESGKCGNRRGADCQFDDAFLKKKTDPKKLSKKPLILVPAPVVKPSTIIKDEVKSLNPNKSIIKQVMSKDATNADKTKKQDKPKPKPKPKKQEEENPYGN